MGQYIGRFKLGHFKLGNSATLFSGLLISYFLTQYTEVTILLSKSIFQLSLIGFIASVGLLASRDIASVIKKYGFKFLILSFVITFTGALSTKIMTQFFSEMRYGIIGTYVGSLTSSPGLATALELAEKLPENTAVLIGLGYSIAYIPGILLVIFFSQFMGRQTNDEVSLNDNMSLKKKTIDDFSIIRFAFVITIGILLGSFVIRFTDGIQFSLGMTGGVLISSLFFGSQFKSFQFNESKLEIIKDISLNLFLAFVGLKYGYESIHAIQTSGLIILMIGMITGGVSILSGYLLGRYVLKIENVYLVGGICGGMTSTPGLAAALDAFDDENVIAGYGATYPFALIFMIIFTNLLFTF